MAGETTTTSANDYVLAAELLASRILPFFYGHNNVSHLIRYETIAGSPTTAADFPISGQLAAASMPEGVDTPYTQFTTGKVTLTVSTVGLVLGLTDLLDKSQIVDMGHYAEQGGMALANKVTTDVLALNAGLSQTAGATGVDLTEANILTAIQTLGAGGVPGPYNGVLHNIQWFDLAGSVGSTINTLNAPGSDSVAQATRTFGAEPAFSGGLNNLYGVNWTVNSNVPTMAAGADRAGCVVNPRYAYGLVSKWDARVEFQRDASALLTEIVVTACYAVGELRDAAGVLIQTDA